MTRIACVSRELRLVRRNVGRAHYARAQWVDVVGTVQSRRCRTGSLGHGIFSAHIGESLTNWGSVVDRTCTASIALIKGGSVKRVGA